jgi:hypothetical protein
MSTTKDISEKAMLVQLSISQWTGKRVDQKASQEVIDANSALPNSGKFNKNLLNQNFVGAFKRVSGDARTFHYQNSLPWGDDDFRILPSENYMEYSKAMRDYKAKFEKVTKEFIASYPVLIKEAKKALGGLFNQNDYPDPVALASRFKFSVNVRPLPTRGDFRVKLAKDEQEKIADQIEEDVTFNVKNAMREVWERLFTAVKHVSEKLKDSDAIFRDSLIGNVQELTDLLPRLNVLEDPELDKIISEVKGNFEKTNPEELRKSTEEREKTASQADDILKKMSGYMSQK